MTIINRKSPELASNRKLSKMPVHINVGGKAVYFTSMAANLTGLGEGKFIQFINDGNEWSFYVNEDTDGFEAKRADKRGNSRRIHNSGLVVMILKSFGFKNSKIFYIEKTAMTKDNCPIFKMIINKV